jgi:hypothetical protein
MKDAMVAVLLAAVSMEAATHWVADRLDPAFRAEIEMRELDIKWADLVERRDGDRPDMGSGLGQRLSRLAEDRNWIAHYPGKRRTTHATPRPRDGGLSEARAHFTAVLASESIVTATEAIRAIGEVWARPQAARGSGQAFDATMSHSGPADGGQLGRHQLVAGTFQLRGYRRTRDRTSDRIRAVVGSVHATTRSLHCVACALDRAQEDVVRQER